MSKYKYEVIFKTNYIDEDGESSAATETVLFDAYSDRSVTVYHDMSIMKGINHGEYSFNMGLVIPKNEEW